MPIRRNSLIEVSSAKIERLVIEEVNYSRRKLCPVKWACTRTREYYNLNQLIAGLLIVIFVLEIPAAQAVAMQGIPTTLSIVWVKSTPWSILSAHYPFSGSETKDFLVDVSGILGTPSSIAFERSPMNGLVFIFTVYKDNQIVKTGQSYVTVFESPYSAYWTAKFLITVPLPDAYARFNLVAYFAGSEKLSSSTTHAPLFLD
jgi:hypothetical protein